MSSFKYIDLNVPDRCAEQQILLSRPPFAPGGITQIESHIDLLEYCDCFVL